MYDKLASNSDEQLLAEVARRKLDLHDKITDAVVRETYDFGKVISLYSFLLEQPRLPVWPLVIFGISILWQVLGHGASGEVLLAIHKVTQQQFACKVVRKDTKMNDAQVKSHISEKSWWLLRFLFVE